MRKLAIFMLACFTSMHAEADLTALEQNLSTVAIQSQGEYSIYEYQGQLHYVIDYSYLCCDRGATLHNEKGELVCYRAGFTGMWEDRCKTFPKEAKFIKDISSQE